MGKWMRRIALAAAALDLGNGVPDQRCITPLRFVLHRIRDTYGES